MFLQTEFAKLKELRLDGFVMENEEAGITVRCTTKFVDAWKERGFKVKIRKPIRLIGR